MIKTIKPKEREAIIKSLRSGVVPRIGLQHIQVGRNNELKSFIKDIDIVADGGSSFRFVIGEYGSGKTFFLSLVRSIALEKGLVTMNADLSPIKKLHGSKGEAQRLITDLVLSLSTRTRQDGNALQIILDRFISNAQELAKQKNIIISDAIYKMLDGVRDCAGGYSFAKVIDAYWKAYESGNDILKDSALRWLKGEYTTKTEAFDDLKVREYLNDSSLFNVLILYSALVNQAGYKGLMICIDEMVNLYKVSNSIARKANYEVVLNILNSTLQGSLSGLGFIMSGTPELLTDTKRGMYSYEALKSRLAENSLSKQVGVVDYNATVLSLANLTVEELYVLLKNIRNVFAGGNPEEYLVPDECLTAYMNHCFNKIGASYFRTPRNTIKGFLDLLSIIEQYPDKRWNEIIPEIAIDQDVEENELDAVNSMLQSNIQEDEFSSFKL